MTSAISLFTGAGGMDVGFKKAGFNIVVANEIDKNACKTYRKNHPKSDLIEGDINDFIDDFNKFKKIDVVFGGPPCQGFSVAGKMDPKDERSKLVFSFFNIVEKTNPKCFVMENVKSLGTLKKFEEIRKSLTARAKKKGYLVSELILNARDFGVPQSRERFFLIGIKKRYSAVSHEDFEPYKSESLTLRDAISHLGRAGSPTNSNTTKAKITFAIKPVLRKSPYAGMLFNGQGRPLNPDSWSSTLPATMGGNRTPIIDECHLYEHKKSWVEDYHHKLRTNKIKAEPGNAPSHLRRLTIHEAAIIQSFPKDYIFEGPQTSVFSQIGNAVPCKLAEVVAMIIHKKISKFNRK